MVMKDHDSKSAETSRSGCGRRILGIDSCLFGWRMDVHWARDVNIQDGRLNMEPWRPHAVSESRFKKERPPCDADREGAECRRQLCCFSVIEIKGGLTVDPWTTWVWATRVHLFRFSFSVKRLQYYTVRSWLNQWHRGVAYTDAPTSSYTWLSTAQRGHPNPLIVQGSRIIHFNNSLCSMNVFYVLGTVQRILSHIISFNHKS